MTSITTRHSTAQHLSTAQHTRALKSAAQHSTAQHSTAQHSTAERSTGSTALEHSTALEYSAAEHSVAGTAQRTWKVGEADDDHDVHEEDVCQVDPNPQPDPPVLIGHVQARQNAVP